MTEFDNFMMPIMEMRRNQKTDQVFQPHDKGKAFKIDNLLDVLSMYKVCKWTFYIFAKNLVNNSQYADHYILYDIVYIIGIYEYFH